jgi:hypothetical protein
MIFDTNLIIRHVRLRQALPAQVIIPIVVAGELEAFALKSDIAASSRYHNAKFSILSGNSVNLRKEECYGWKRCRTEALAKAPEERPVPRNGTQLNTSPIGAYCLKRTGRSYGTLSPKA